MPSVSVITSTRDVNAARLLSPPPPDMNRRVAPLRMKDMPQKKTPLKPNGEPDHSKMNMKPDATQKPIAGNEGMKSMDGMDGTDRVEGRREAMGMRPGWSMGVEGLFTVVRVLPPELYDKIMGSQEHEGHHKQP